MLSVTPPFMAKAVQNSRTSSVSKLPIFGVGKSTFQTEERPPRQVERGAHQRLVHRQQAGAIAADAALVAERLREAAPERDAHVLDRMVVVDMQVACRLHLEVDEGMACDLLKHVVEEADPGRDPGGSAAVEDEADTDGGLGGFAADLGLTHGRPP